LGGIGTAGVPAGSLPVVALICGMVGVPPEGIGLILGVDRFLDMCRTTVNVSGDLGIAALVSRGGAGPACGDPAPAPCPATPPGAARRPPDAMTPTRRDLANAIRFLAIDAVEAAKSGHPGMPMGMADIAEVLWNDYLQHNPGNPKWFNRDRFVLSNGHGSMLQ